MKNYFSIFFKLYLLSIGNREIIAGKHKRVKMVATNKPHPKTRATG